MKTKDIQEISNNLDEVINIVALLSNKLEVIERRNIEKKCNCSNDKFYSWLVREFNNLFENLSNLDPIINQNEYNELNARLQSYNEIALKYIDFKNKK